MDRSKVEALIRDLDGAVPREGALVRLDLYGGGSDESGLRANRLGYLRFGIEFLKAGITTQDADPIILPLGAVRTPTVHVDLDYLVDQDSGVQLQYFEWDEDIRRGAVDEARSEWPNGVAAVGCGAALIAVAALLLIGAGTVLRWLS